MNKTRVRPEFKTVVLAVLLSAVASTALGMSPEEVFDLVSPSVMVVVGSTPGEEEASQGSGVVVAREAVATNCHVLRYQKQAEVYTPNGKRWDAILTGVDWHRDICILHVRGLTAPPVVLGKLEDLRIGQKIYAIGSPQGLSQTLSDGLLSGFRDFGFGNLIQITAPISEGSSGGGVFDERGVLLGITTSSVEGSQNLNFAHPANWIVELLRKGSKIQAPSELAVKPAAEEAVVNVYNWSDYIEPRVLEQFTRETGIRVNYDVFDSNEALEIKLLAGNTGYDVVVPSASFMELQIGAGLFKKLDRSKLSNWKNLDPELLKRVALHDPGNAHSVNHMWGTDGIGYNEGKLKAIAPDAPVDSWQIVFDPKWASKIAECGISVLDAPSEIVGVALAYLGKDPNSENPDDLKLAEDMLMKIRPYIRMIHSSNYIDALANGEICLAVGWSGDIRAIEAKQGNEIKYSIPKEGTVIWFDMYAIPADAPHSDNAHAFINFMLRPDVAAANSNLVQYANGNLASLPLIDEAIRNDPNVYPPPAVKAKLFPDLAESSAFTRLLIRSWTRFTAGS